MNTNNKNNYARRVGKGIAAGTLTAVLAGCAGQMTNRNINQEYREQVSKISKPYNPVSRDLEYHLGHFTSLPQAPKPKYDVENLRGFIDNEDFNTVRRIADALDYIETLEDHKAFAHLVIEHFDKITNGDLSKIFLGYKQEAANQTKSYLGSVGERLKNGYIEGEKRRAEHNIKNILDSKKKKELQEIVDGFKNKATNLKTATRLLTMIGRQFGYYDREVSNTYEVLERTTTGNDPYSLGKKVVEHQGIKLDDLENIAKGGTDYDLRSYTHPIRKQLSDAYKKNEIRESELHSAIWYLTRKEAEAASTITVGNGLSLDDAIPVWGLLKALTTHLGQSGGYEGLAVEESKRFIDLVTALEYGATDKPINMSANEHRLSAFVGIATTALPFAIAGISGAGGNGGGGESPIIPPIGNNEGIGGPGGR